MNGLIVLIILVILWGAWKILEAIFTKLSDIINHPQRKREQVLKEQETKDRNAAKEKARLEYLERTKVEQERKIREEAAFLEKYRTISLEDLLLDKNLDEYKKIRLLKEIHNHSMSDAKELLKTAGRAEKKAKLSAIKRKVFQKAQELHGLPETNGGRKPIPDDVKMFVWNRDGGKCVNCGSRDTLEFDHIIPVVKGGSNTGRNIQLLCEKCNRAKSDSIV